MIKTKVLAAGLAMAGVAGVVGLTQMASASAATLGTVRVIVLRADADNPGAGVDQARNLCASWPNTKTVQFDHSEINNDRATQFWNCLD
jgi:hypothetical protein